MTVKKEDRSRANTNGQDEVTSSTQYCTTTRNGGQNMTPDQYMTTTIPEGQRNSELFKQIIFARERDWPSEGLDRLCEKAVRLDGLTPAEVAKTRRSAEAKNVSVTTHTTKNTTPRPTPRPPAERKLDLINWLSVVFEPGDHVLLVTGQKNGEPLILNHKSERVMDLIGRVQKDGIDKVIQSDATAGAWILINPVQAGAKQEHITSFRNCLIEGDEQPIAEQIRILRQSGLPIRAMVHSGNKSVHAVVATDAEDAEQYAVRRNELWQIAEDHGLKLDRSNKNANRCTRLPSVKRNGNWQYVIQTDEYASYDAWSRRNDPWQPMNLNQVFSEDPPARDWIFGDMIGAGDLCGIAAEGGSGKTYLALIMAVSLTSGRCLLPAFKPLGARRCMVLCGEDQSIIVWQRLKAIALEYGLTPAELDRVQANLTIIAGVSEPLTGATNQGPCRTARWSWLRDQIQRLDPALLILDPKSRWDGGLSENDAACTSAFVTAVQDLIGDQRAALVLHHVAKLYAQNADSGAARGSTALRDGCRWFANMTRLSDSELKDFDLEPEDPFIRLTVNKSNYSAALPGPVYLRRAEHGVLRQEDLRASKSERLARRLREWLLEFGCAGLRDLRQGRGGDYKALKEFFGDHLPKKRDLTQAVDFAITHGLVKIKDDNGKQVLVP